MKANTLVKILIAVLLFAGLQVRAQISTKEMPVTKVLILKH
jgi:hypothetical protein